MSKRFWMIVLLTAALTMTSLAYGSGFAAESGAKEEAPVLLDFSAYAGAGGSVLLVEEEAVPAVDLRTGILIKPWLGLGAYFFLAPLSSFEHADLGVSVADRRNAYMFRSGMEILLVPFQEKRLHPIFSLRAGGITAGYGVDLDGNSDTLEAVEEQRFFAAGATGGFEFNICRHYRITGVIGYSLAANEELMGIGAGNLSGLTAGLGLRTVWRTQIR